MVSPEQFYQPPVFESPSADQGNRLEQATTSSQMERVVTQLAAAYGVDLSQPGANLTLSVPDQHQQWLLANLDGQRIGVTQCVVTEENLISPEIDMVFEVKPSGWEPVELIHTEEAWSAYAQAAHATETAVAETPEAFNWATFADQVAQGLAQHAPSEASITVFRVAPGVPTEQRQPPPLDGQPETETHGSMLPVTKAAALLGITPQAVNHIIKIGQAQTEIRQITEVVERQRAITFVSLSDLQQYREHTGQRTRKRHKQRGSR